MTTPAAPPLPKTVVLLGVPFHDVTMDETLAHIDAMIADGTTRYLATANLDFAAQASEDVELQRILLEAHLVLCDGTPLIWASKWLKAPIRERVAGSDLMPVLTAHCAAQGHRMFLLGATDETLDLAKAKMIGQHPDLQIVGTYAPPIAKLLDFDNDEILRRIHAARPDVLIVCFGCPKQEKWIYMNQPRLGVPVSIGLGATLDFVAGNFKRAPVWMRRSGLEWVYRLSQEPKRLFNRYLFDLMFFVASLRRQRRQLQDASSSPNSHPSPPPDAAPLVSPSVSGNDAPALVLKWTGRCDAAAVHDGTLDTADPSTDAPLVLLDLADVTYLDSTALGLLLRMFRESKAARHEFCLLAPSPPVTGLLSAMRLDRLVPAVASLEEIRTRFDHATLPSQTPFNEMVLGLEGDITAARVAELRAWVEKRWQDKPAARRLVLDLRQVNFIDSSGIGLLVVCKRLAESRPESTFRIHNVNANIRNVLDVSRMTAFFQLDAPEDPA